MDAAKSREAKTVKDSLRMLLTLGWDPEALRTKRQEPYLITVQGSTVEELGYDEKDIIRTWKAIGWRA